MRDCHEGQILLVAANVAKDQGIPVDREKLDLWTDRWVLVDALIDYQDGRLNGLGIPTAPFALLHRDHDRDRSEDRARRWAERAKHSVPVARGRWFLDPKGSVC